VSDPAQHQARTIAAEAGAERSGALQLVTAQPNPFVGMSRRFFAGGDRGRQLDELRHPNRWQRRVVAVTGGRGLGKSALFRALSGRLDAGVKAARINANLTSDAREVLVGVLQGLGAATPPGGNPQQLAASITAHVEAQATAQRQCLVLVDDAHLLDWRALEHLLRIVDSTSADALRVAFFAETPFVPALERACQRMQNVRAWHEIRLAPFDENDMRRYLTFRLEDAGVAGPVPFTAAELELVWRQSRGLPGHVNELAAALVDGALRVVEEGRWLPRGHRALVLSLGAAVVASWLVVAAWMREPSTVLPMAAGDAGTSVGVARAGDAARDVDTLTVPVHAVPSVADRPDAAESVAAASGAAAPVETGRRASGAADAERPEIDRGVAEVAAPAPSRPPAAVEPRASTEPLAPAQPRDATAARGAEWFFDQPRTHHTLQLFGTSDRAQWSRWVRDHADARLASFETLRDGKPWFVVTYGSYASRAEAEAAARRLPAAFGDVEPWIRTFGAIQDSIGR
jgi:DamX protein